MLLASVICSLLGLAVATPTTARSTVEESEMSSKTGSLRKNDLYFLGPEENRKSERDIILIDDMLKKYENVGSELRNGQIVYNNGTVFNYDKSFYNDTVYNNGAVFNKGAYFTLCKVSNQGAVFNLETVYNCSTVTDSGTVYNIAPTFIDCAV